MAQKILYVINHIDWFWSHRLPLAVGARKDGWDVSVAVTGADQDKKLAEHNFKGLELPASDQGFGPLRLLQIKWEVHKHLRDEKPDVVHAITLKYAFITGLAARFHKKIRVVHTLAGLGYLFSDTGMKPKILRFFIGPLLKAALKYSRVQIIFQNPDDQRLMIKSGFVREEQCHLIRGSGVDIRQFSPKKLARNDVPLIVMPTRLVHDKGIAVFIDAARILKAQGFEAKFQIAGGITANNPLAISEGEMQDMVADGAVEWLGKVDDMPALLARADMVVYPSYYREGIPKVLLEAAAMAKPIITTDHPGCREAVDHGENGLLVNVRDPQATADAIAYLLKDHGQLTNMGAKSREKAENEFDVRLIVKQTLKVYQRF